MDLRAFLWKEQNLRMVCSVCVCVCLHFLCLPSLVSLCPITSTVLLLLEATAARRWTFHLLAFSSPLGRSHAIRAPAPQVRSEPLNSFRGLITTKGSAFSPAESLSIIERLWLAPLPAGPPAEPTPRTGLRRRLNAAYQSAAGARPPSLAPRDWGVNFVIIFRRIWACVWGEVGSNSGNEAECGVARSVRLLWLVLHIIVAE